MDKGESTGISYSTISYYHGIEVIKTYWTTYWIWGSRDSRFSTPSFDIWSHGSSPLDKFSDMFMMEWGCVGYDAASQANKSQRPAL